MAEALVKIAEYTVPTATNNFTFTSIPQTYQDLILYDSSQMVKGGGGDWYDISYVPNGTVANLEGRLQYAYNNNQQSALAESNWISRTSTPSISAYDWGVAYSVILDYASSSNTKRWILDSYAPSYQSLNTGTIFAHGGGIYTGGAITSLMIQGIGGYNIRANSRFILYGMSKS